MELKQNPFDLVTLIFLWCFDWNLLLFPVLLPHSVVCFLNLASTPWDINQFQSKRKRRYSTLPSQEAEETYFYCKSTALQSIVYIMPQQMHYY